MTKRLEELFDLESGTEEPEILPDPIPDSETGLISTETLSTIEKVENSLPQVRGLEASDQEMDDLSNLAKEAFNNLMDLGMQVDSRFSAEIFNSASSMLGHAITAKTAKVNKKLRMLDLQLKKADLERKIAAAEKTEPGQPTPLGQATVIDRNDLLKQLVAQAKNGNNDK
jgi:hypothetical protein